MEFEAAVVTVGAPAEYFLGVSSRLEATYEYKLGSSRKSSRVLFYLFLSALIDAVVYCL